MALNPITPTDRPDALSPADPPGTDVISEGDNHLRGVKIVLKNFWQDYNNFRVYVLQRLAAIDAALNDASQLDALSLGGFLANTYQDASQLDSGLLPLARLVGNYNIDVAGAAPTATLADHVPEAATATDTNLLQGHPLSDLASSASGFMEYNAVQEAVAAEYFATRIRAQFTVSARNYDRVMLVAIPFSRTPYYNVTQTQCTLAHGITGWTAGRDAFAITHTMAYTDGYWYACGFVLLPANTSQFTTLYTLVLGGNIWPPGYTHGQIKVRIFG